MSYFRQLEPLRIWGTQVVAFQNVTDIQTGSAPSRTRTCDRLVKSDLLYRLSYRVMS